MPRRPVRHLAAGIATAVLVLSAGARSPASGQEVLPTLVGGAAGLAAGGYVSVGIWTAKARWNDEFLYAARDALGWEVTPVLAGTLTGATVGFVDQDRLRRTIIGGAAGWFLGTGIGMTYGAARWRPPEGRWAGGVIGGAAGLVVGSAVGLLWPGGDDDTAPEALPSRAAGVPLGITIRF